MTDPWDFEEPDRPDNATEEFEQMTGYNEVNPEVKE